MFICCLVCLVEVLFARARDRLCVCMGGWQCVRMWLAVGVHVRLHVCVSVGGCVELCVWKPPCEGGCGCGCWCVCVCVDISVGVVLGAGWCGCWM